MREPERSSQPAAPAGDTGGARPVTARGADAGGVRDGAAASRAVVGGRHLPVAIAVGLVLAGAFLGTLFWHPLAFVTLIAGLTVVAYVESGRVLAGVGIRIGVPVLIVATLVMLYGTYQARFAGLALGVVVLFLGTVGWQLADGQRRDVAQSMATTVLFGLWVGALASFAALLVVRSDGAVLVLAVVGAAILSDIGGYVFGVTLGRHKLAPVLSPNKTWEGFAGALVIPVVLAALALPVLDDRFTPLVAGVVAGTASLAAMVGDLAESMLKRDLGVKDLGAVLPGHGGVLDRVDGILFALPVGALALELLVT